MTGLAPRVFLLAALVATTLSAQRGADSAAARLHAVSRQRHLRRWRHRRLDRHAGTRAADLRVQVDDAPQQRGGAQGRHAGSVGGKATIEIVADEPGMIYVAVEAYEDLTPATPTPADAMRRASPAATRDATPASMPSAQRSRRRRSALSTPRPADFDAFWDGKLAAQAKLADQPSLTPVETDVPGVEMSMFELDALGSKAHGYVAKPARDGQVSGA